MGKGTGKVRSPATRSLINQPWRNFCATALGLFLGYTGLGDRCRKQILSSAKTVTMTTIGQDGIGDIVVALPPLDEQLAIAGLLQSADHRIARERSVRGGLEKLKRSVADALLSGEVRVDGATGG